MPQKQRVTYFYDNEFATFYFGQNHPMKPHRLAMTHQLVLGYGLHEQMHVYRPRKAFPSELAQFHTPAYVSFLSKVRPDNVPLYTAEMREHNFNDDCPVFDGLFDFCRLYAGASIQAAQQLNSGVADIAINWGGGLHHAKKNEASGFCYVNDLVLAILELLKEHARVLYVDIDVHHGDGVEEAFYTTDRVMTVSFHKYGDFFFPGTGDLRDVGEYNGRLYSINVPLRDGTDDSTFLGLFRPIMGAVMDSFRPGCIVLQCGADSLAHDRLGCFNLSAQGHSEAVAFLKGYGLPMLVTGGGGYTKHNVARCWAHETAVLLGVALPDALPPTDYHAYFGPTHCLDVRARHTEQKDTNTREYVDRIRTEILENLRHLRHAPGAGMDTLPPAALCATYEPDGADIVDRIGKYARDHLVIKEDAYGEEQHLGEAGV